MTGNGSPVSADVEKKAPMPTGSSRSSRISYLNLMLSHGYINSTISEHPYPGVGTLQDPYIIGWIPDDPRNPQLFNDSTKWFWTLLVALANFAVALATSAYTAHAKEVKAEFHVSQEVFELGLSLFVLGFALVLSSGDRSVSCMDDKSYSLER
jgi:hypothetical protein